MPDSQRPGNGGFKVTGLLESVSDTRRRQIIIALLCFLLPLLLAIPLLRRRDVAWQSSGLQGIPVRGLAANQDILITG